MNDNDNLWKLIAAGDLGARVGRTELSGRHLALRDVLHYRLAVVEAVAPCPQRVR